MSSSNLSNLESQTLPEPLRDWRKISKHPSKARSINIPRDFNQFFGRTVWTEFDLVEKDKLVITITNDRPAGVSHE